MKNNVIKMINENEAQVSKTFAKNAKIYGTPEYKLWREFKAENPEYVMVVKSIKKNPNKKTNKNLTYKNMEMYISKQKDSEKLSKEYWVVRDASKLQKNPYTFVVDWFKTRFNEYNSFEQFFKEDSENEETENEETANDNTLKECA